MQGDTGDNILFTSSEVAEATRIEPNEVRARCRDGSIRNRPGSDGTFLIPDCELDRILGDATDGCEADGAPTAAD